MKKILQTKPKIDILADVCQFTVKQEFFTECNLIKSSIKMLVNYYGLMIEHYINKLIDINILK